MASSIEKPKRKRNDENDPYWEISSKRRITIQTFKGMTLVSIREYYEKDGKQLPGKQGISLNMDQFSTLLAALGDIKSSLKVDFNEKLPDIEENVDTGAEHSSDDVEEEDDSPEPESKKSRKKRRLSESPDS